MKTVNRQYENREPMRRTWEPMRTSCEKRVARDWQIVTGECTCVGEGKEGILDEPYDQIS